MCISYIHTIPQFSFNTILLLHFKFTTIKHVYEQGCMENIHNRRFDGCEILEKQISACFYSQFKIWLPFDKLKQFARVCRSLAEKRHLLWTEHRSRDTARKKIRDKKGQGARTLKRGEDRVQPFCLHLRPLCANCWQPHGKLLLSSHQRRKNPKFSG